MMMGFMSQMMSMLSGSRVPPTFPIQTNHQQALCHHQFLRIIRYLTSTLINLKNTLLTIVHFMMTICSYYPNPTTSVHICNL